MRQVNSPERTVRPEQLPSSHGKSAKKFSSAIRVLRCLSRPMVGGISVKSLALISNSDKETRLQMNKIKRQRLGISQEGRGCFTE